MHGILIAAPASGQGKTTVTLGVLAALRSSGIDVVSAKSGPDYIDPGFHRAATGRACLTLDSWSADDAQLRARAEAFDADLLVVEGAMGLFDAAAGQPAGGRGSAQCLAAALDLPVILVVDAARMGQSVGALVSGFASQSGRLAGVILNRVASARHEAMLRTAMGDVPVVGVLPMRSDLVVPSRHLGLVQAGEQADLVAFIERAAEWVRTGCDLQGLRGLSRPVAEATAPRRLQPPGQRIAVARDQAFGFSYAHMLGDWRAAGAELSFFSPLADEGPGPGADAVFLPGGYPELHAHLLAANGGFLDGLRKAAEHGALIYGECGGYMVLGQGLIDADGTRHAMAGLLDLETSFAERRRHLGYRALTPTGAGWPGPARGHEFHYATTIRASGDPLFRAGDAEGTDLGTMGLRSGRIMGSFAHVVEPT